MIPPSLARNLRFPAIAAPMFLVSGPELVIATCKAGMIGTFPALNQRTSKGYVEWLAQIKAGYANGVMGWILWNPRSAYSSDALLPAASAGGR